MKTFANRDAGTLEEAVRLAREALDGGQSVSFAGGGTDLLQLVKDRIANRPGQGVPDILVSLRGLEDLSGIAGQRPDGGEAMSGLRLAQL
ncbi:MAG: hypothetical protein F4X36_18850, partial [Gammaproteobacteria bacterium]|nr:hypothetical protein [Gammaproteobacteria bacterium]